MNADTIKNNGFQQVRAHIDELVASCTHLEERRIGYGNLRCEYSNWERASEEVTNIALIYETPGGSTCQINVDYDHDTAEFNFLGNELQQTITTRKSQDVVTMVDHHVRNIPQKRLTFLQQQIDEWVAAGKTKSQLFAELNKLLQTEFLGGRISTTELKKGIEYILKRYSTKS